jgi:hypothetical protein
MKMLTARVVGGRLDLPADELPEGATVTVLVPDDEPIALTAEQREQLKDSIAQANRGETINAREFLRSLRSER